MSNTTVSAEHSYYEYGPSKGLAIVSTLLFGATMGYSVFQYIKYKSWVWAVFLIAIAMEVIGFGARIKSIDDPTNMTLYALQFALVVLAPVLMAGNIYVIFGRLIYLVTPPRLRNIKTLWCPPRFVTLIFVIFDVISIFMQLIGSVKMTSVDVTDPDAKSKTDSGRKIALIGVIVQLIAFGFFTVMALRFRGMAPNFASHYELRIERNGAQPGHATLRGTNIIIKYRWNHFLLAICGSCALILLRSVFRMIEFGAKDTKVGDKIDGSEVFLYVLDALPMLIVAVIFNLFHPGMYLPFLGFKLPKEEKRSSDDETELKAVPPSQDY